MATEEPVITKENTADGWITTADYGKQGVSVARVHIAQSSPDTASKNRAGLDRILRQLGYRLAE